LPNYELLAAEISREEQQTTASTGEKPAGADHFWEIIAFSALPDLA
jgi:hypothetical protein